MDMRWTIKAAVTSSYGIAIHPTNDCPYAITEHWPKARCGHFSDAPRFASTMSSNSTNEVAARQPFAPGDSIEVPFQVVGKANGDRLSQ